MDRFFGRKRKAPEPSQHHTPPVKHGNITPGSSSFQAEWDIGHEDYSSSTNSRIAHQDKASELWTPDPASAGTRSYSDTEHGHRLTDRGAADTGVGSNGSAELSRVTKRARKDTAHGDVGEDAAERFGPLKVVLGSIPAVYANDKGLTPIGNKVEDLLSRIVVLEEHFDSRPSDVAEQRRRDDLRRELGGIERQLQSLTGVPELHTEEIPALLEGVREAIFSYQMEQQKDVYNQQCREIDPAEAMILNNFRSAQGAEYRHGDRNGCLKGTRGAVLDEIEIWTRNFSEPAVYWLNGLAGTGKTTIAQTIAERTFADGRLGASFFCSRDFEDRSNLRFIFPTLAVQLARKYIDFRSLFVPLVRSDPGIAHESLFNQMHKLIFQPLKEANISTVVIIDALDECKDEEPASVILSVLGQFASKIPMVKFLVTGRPEPRIREGFRLPLLAEVTNVFVLHEVERDQVWNDIRLFFGHKFSELVRRRRGLDDWPTEEHLDLLCKRAAGLFVYAVATVKFIDKQSCNPRRQLDLLLQSPENTTHEGKTKFKPNTTLDSLYTSILQEAFGDDDDLHPKVQLVLGAMILASNPLSPSTIAKLLGLDPEDVFPLLSSVQSLLILQEDIDCPVRPFHKSFPDFITDPDRCTNRRFHVFPPDHHSRLLTNCLNLADRTLEKNMCQLPDCVANSDVSDLKERIERYIDPALRYACKSWHEHLVDRHTTSVETVSGTTLALHRLLERHFLSWLEVLSILGAVRSAIDALQAAVDWLEELPTLDLVKDCSRFVTGFFEIISTSSPHIYHSGLVWTPETSIVWKLYGSHARPFTKIVHGLPVSWDSNIAAILLPFQIELAAWSPCNKFIAVGSNDTTVVAILDSATLQPLQSLEFPQETFTRPNALAFSPDSRTVTCSCRSGPELSVVSWDIQTGSVVSTIKKQGLEDEYFTNQPCILYSIDGKMVGVLYCYQTTTIISIYDLVSGVYMHDVYHHQDTSSSHPLRLYSIWTHGESIRFATAPGGTTINIWEVGFAAGATCTKVETLSVPRDSIKRDPFFKPITQVATPNKFLPASCRDPFTIAQLMHGLLVWVGSDVGVVKDHQMTFSSDGRFFACSTAGSEVYFWKMTSIGYTLQGKLVLNLRCSSPLLSPNGHSAIVFDGSMIRLWPTKGITTPSSILARAPRQNKNFIVEFLASRPLAAIARQADNTVAVIDIKSGLPQLTIHAGMQVHGLVVIENAVVVIGSKKITTWNLPSGNFPPDARMDISDSARTVTFDGDLQTNCEIIAASVSSDFRYLALILLGRSGIRNLCVYNASTGRFLSNVVVEGSVLWFAPDGRDIWCIGGNEAEMLTVTRGWLDRTTPAVGIDNLPRECPWRPSHGYRDANDGWILCPRGRRLLILSPHGRSNAEGRVWNGNFLALQHGVLPDGPIILELES